jgi:hypothetical protein
MDEVDRTEERIERELAAAVAAARGQIPPGSAGDCDLCGEWSGRLIDGACAPCRDRAEARRRLTGLTR